MSRIILKPKGDFFCIPVTVKILLNDMGLDLPNFETNFEEILKDFNFKYNERNIEYLKKFINLNNFKAIEDNTGCYVNDLNIIFQRYNLDVRERFISQRKMTDYNLVNRDNLENFLKNILCKFHRDEEKILLFGNYRLLNKETTENCDPFDEGLNVGHCMYIYDFSPFDGKFTIISPDSNYFEIIRVPVERIINSIFFPSKRNAQSSFGLSIITKE